MRTKGFMSDCTKDDEVISFITKNTQKMFARRACVILTGQASRAEQEKNWPKGIASRSCLNSRTIIIIFGNFDALSPVENEAALG